MGLLFTNKLFLRTLLCETENMEHRRGWSLDFSKITGEITCVLEFSLGGSP